MHSILKLPSFDHFPCYTISDFLLRIERIPEFQEEPLFLFCSTLELLQHCPSTHYIFEWICNSFKSFPLMFFLWMTGCKSVDDSTNFIEEALAHHKLVTQRTTHLQVSTSSWLLILYRVMGCGASTSSPSQVVHPVIIRNECLTLPEFTTLPDH